MKTLRKMMAGFVFFAGCSASEPRWDSVRYAPQRLDLYRAESERAVGLEEHVVPRTGQSVYVNPAPDISIHEITEAVVELPAEGPGLLLLRFTAAGQQKIDAIAREHSGRPMAIFVDGKI